MPLPRGKNPAKRQNLQNLLRRAKGVTAIGRHSIKGKTPSGLTEQGKGKAKWAGKKLPQGFKVYGRAGELPRQRMTARLMVNSYPGSKEMRIPIKAEIGFKWLKDIPAIEKEIAATSDPAYLAKWIDGKTDSSVIEPATTVGRTILRERIGETQNLIHSTAERPFVVNVSSSWFDAAQLKALGIDYRQVKPKRLNAKNPPKQGESLKETESLLFFHMPNGRFILRFRGKAFDVTKQLTEILK